MHWKLKFTALFCAGLTYYNLWIEHHGWYLLMIFHVIFEFISMTLVKDKPAETESEPPYNEQIDNESLPARRISTPRLALSGKSIDEIETVGKTPVT